MNLQNFKNGTHKNIGKPCRGCNTILTLNNASSNGMRYGRMYYKDHCKKCHSFYTSYAYKMKREKSMQKEFLGIMCGGCTVKLTEETATLHEYQNNEPVYRRWCKECYRYITHALKATRDIRTGTTYQTTSFVIKDPVSRRSILGSKCRICAQILTRDNVKFYQNKDKIKLVRWCLDCNTEAHQDKKQRRDNKRANDVAKARYLLKKK